jgi:hypothetical protein
MFPLRGVASSGVGTNAVWLGVYWETGTVCAGGDISVDADV